MKAPAFVSALMQKLRGPMAGNPKPADSVPVSYRPLSVLPPELQERIKADVARRLAAKQPTLEQAVLAAKLPDALAMALIARNDRAVDPAAQIAHARAINDICHAARRPAAAAVYVQLGTPPNRVRALLQAAWADEDEEISTALALPAIGGTWDAATKKAREHNSLKQQPAPAAAKS